jgi:hypothetical protein
VRRPAACAAPRPHKQGNLIKTVSSVSVPYEGTPLVDILGAGIVDLIKNLVLLCGRRGRVIRQGHLQL